ncbi:hypothetical protein [Bradyrhizobium sp. CCGUVB14]|uniref:hypothetical protein n=1 Tax=Bradyrhizobium sp. CCGUVB14 TaxID=2949628 RepID=UPI00281126BF|nr:hypothetical protein [Bradyrhizobium sp. CCGUVB14]
MPEDAAPIDFTGLIQDGDLVVRRKATAEPVTLTEVLVTQAAHLPPFRVMVEPLFSDTFSAWVPNVSLLSYGVIGNARRAREADKSWRRCRGPAYAQTITNSNAGETGLLQATDSA